MKKGTHFLSILLLMSLLFSGLPMYVVHATEYENSGENSESADDTNTDNDNADIGQGQSESITQGTDTESVPKSYNLPIESNNLKSWPQGDAVEADAAAVLDVDTGVFLYSKNMEAKEYPASITKIMTTLLALEHGNLDDVITFSENAIYNIEPDSTHLGIQPGEQLTLRQSLYGVMMASANEISNGVAEHIGGTIENFAQMMNDKAAELGCTNTHFVNPHGLHDENHYTSAKDMALIMQAALKNKTFCKIIKTKEYYYPKTNISKEERYFLNHHKMLFSDEEAYYKGCLGGKTGFTDQAMNTLVTYSKKGGRKLISVVMHEYGAPKAYEESTRILEYGFNNFKKIYISNAQENRSFAETIEMGTLGETGKFLCNDLKQKPFVIENQTKVVLPNQVEPESLTKKVDLKNNILTYSYNGYVVGSSKIEIEPAFTEAGLGPQFRKSFEVVSSSTEQDESSGKEEATGVIGIAKEKGSNMLTTIRQILISTYEKVDLFIKDNTVESAVLGGILLLIFIPLLCIAVSRGHRYKKIQKERMAEADVRRKLEEELGKKTLQEIEDEIRATYEEEEMLKRKAEDRRLAAERADLELREAEQILEGEHRQELYEPADEEWEAKDEEWEAKDEEWEAGNEEWESLDKEER